MVENRFKQFPSSLAAQSRAVRFGEVPVLLCHPDPNWREPAPTVIWLHGRTANKELDPGRYLRWVRAGIAACAVDLPGHGERGDPEMQKPEATLDVLRQAVGEVDRVIEHLADPNWGGAFDLDRMAIGGMSLGGMVTLRRLCEAHEFKAAAVEGTTGNLMSLYGGHSPEVETPVKGWHARHDAAKIAEVDAMQHLRGFRPIPLLALHSEADQVVPVASMRSFVDALRGRYKQAYADPGLVQLHTWPETGAPQEHIGFGRVSNDAKNLQVEFLKKYV
ncbi:MAG TPA: prolyl oligopeptidase family serine peptidase [Phycisphaerales bacterium]|nr:prolyl oligopeptidase family serine peptidase [Phycisphaerales bacterium]